MAYSKNQFGLSRQRERFAQLIAHTGKDAGECYIEACSKPRMDRKVANVRGSQWLAHPLIQNRVSTLQASIDWDQIEPKWKVYRQVVDLYEKCVKAEAWAAAAKVLELKLKALQMLSDKLVIDDMRKVTDEELIKKLAGDDPAVVQLFRKSMGVKDSFPKDDSSNTKVA